MYKQNRKAEGNSPRIVQSPWRLAVTVLAFSSPFAAAEAATLTVPGDHATIQAAVDAASSGDQILVGAGTFAENVTTSVPLTIEGTGPGTIIAPTSGVGVTLAPGTDESTRTVLRDLAVTGNGSATGVTAGSFTTIEGVSSTGHVNYGISLQSGMDLVIIDSHFDSNNVGLKLGSTASFAGLSVSGSSFDGNTSHGWYADANSGIQPALDDVTVENSNFSDNGLKGIYVERLSNAVFDGITVTGNANTSSYDWGAGFDLNLKWQDYESITIRNSTFSNNANGSVNGAALTVKARDDAPSYDSPAASLDGVLVEDCQFSGNERHFEAGVESSAGPNGVILRRNSFGAATSGAVANHSLATVQATHNFWGSSKPDFEALVSGDVVFSPWYADAALSNLLSDVVPDLTVGKRRPLRAHKGSGVQASNPNRQRVRFTVKRRSNEKCYVGLTNAGDDAGLIEMRASGRKNRKVRTRIFGTGQASGNVTAKMQRGRYSVNLDAGETVIYRVVKRLTGRAKRAGRRVADRTAFRSQADCGTDTVSAMVKFRP